MSFSGGPRNISWRGATGKKHPALKIPASCKLASQYYHLTNSLARKNNLRWRIDRDGLNLRHQRLALRLNRVESGLVAGRKRSRRVLKVSD